jgi:LAGLIDADG endonuclease
MDYSYIAGYFDGEGSIGIYRNKGSKDTRYKSGFKTPCWIRSLNIVNTYKPILERIHSIFKVGRIYQMKDPHYTRPCWCWTVGAKADIGKVLYSLSPYLVEKLPQAELMIEEIEGRADTASIATKLKTLKRISHV